MQPLKLYIAGGINKIPQEIVIGHTLNGIPVVILIAEILKHFLLRGQSGSGKSRILALLLMELIARGYRVLFIDPLGEIYNLMLSWWSYIARDTYINGEFAWFRDQILPNVLFWDLSDPGHKLRHNMLKPFEGETISDVVARQILFVNAFLSSDGESAMDVQLQRRVNYISLIWIFAATNTSLEQGKNFIYDRQYRDRLLSQAEQRSTLKEVHESCAHFRYLETEFGNRAAEKLNSLETALNTFYENPSVRAFLLSSENNCDFQHILNHQSLFIRTPLCDLPVRKLLLNYFYTVFLYLADKRPQDATPVYLGSDESALVFNDMISDYIARIRNRKVFLVFSHQSIGQMLSSSGENIAKTVASQSGIQFLFRHDYQESETIADEVFSLSGKIPKLIEVTTTVTRSTTESAGTSVSESSNQQKGIALGKNIQEGITETSQKTYSVSETYGISEGIQHQWAESVGNNQTRSYQFGDSFTYSENTGKTLSQLEGNGISFTLGQGKSMLRIETESGVVTIGESNGVSETKSEAHGYSQGRGTSENHSYGATHGSSMTWQKHNAGQTITVIDGAPVPVDKPATTGMNMSLSDFNSTSKSYGDQKNEAWNQLSGIANSVSKMVTKSQSKGSTTGETASITNQEAMALSTQFSKSVALAKSYAKAIQRSLGHGDSHGTSNTSSRSVGDSLSRTQQRALQQGESLALATAESWGTNLSQTLNQGLSQGHEHSYTLNTGMSLSISWKLVYYSMQEERRLYAQMIHALPPRRFYLSIWGKEPVEVITESCYFLPTVFQGTDFRKVLEEYYKILPIEKDRALTLLPTLPKIPLNQPHPLTVLQSLPNEFEHFFP